MLFCPFLSYHAIIIYLYLTPPLLGRLAHAAGNSSSSSLQPPALAALPIQSLAVVLLSSRTPCSQATTSTRLWVAISTCSFHSTFLDGAALGPTIALTSSSRMAATWLYAKVSHALE